MSLKDPANLSEKHHQRVLELIPMEEGEQLLLLYDETALSSVKAGLAITDRRFIKYDKRESAVLRTGEVTRIVLHRERGNPLYHRLEVSAPGGPQITQYMYLVEPDIQLMSGVFARFARPGLDVSYAAASPRTSRINRGRSGFILSTTPTIEGRPIEEYLGSSREKRSSAQTSQSISSAD